MLNCKQETSKVDACTELRQFPVQRVQGSGLARFLEQRGRRVKEVRGVLWYSVPNGFFMSLPYHLCLSLEHGGEQEILHSLGALGIRYPSTTQPGLPSGLYVCRDRAYGIKSTHRGVRHNINDGLRECEVRKLSEEDLLNEGYRINLETMKRQNRFDPQFGDRPQWRRFVRALDDSPCVEAIGAFADGRLGSYAITCLEDGWLHILHKMNELSNRHHPGHVLDYLLTRRLVEDKSIQAVSMGLAPLVPQPGLHDYKIRLGYCMEAQASVIHLSRAAEPFLLNRLSRATVRLLAQSWPTTSVWKQQLGTVAAVLEGARLSRAGGVTAPQPGHVDIKLER